MSKKTPKKSPLSPTNSGFSPITLHTSPAVQSPQKNLTGPPRVIRDIIADLYNNIQSWNSLHVKGCSLVKQIASLKADEPKSYSPQLEEYVNELFMTVVCLKANIDMFMVLTKQAAAFSKLPNVSDPLFFSLSARNISQLVSDVSEAYGKEFEVNKVKEFVLQNIAHTKNQNEAMFLAACWTHQLRINDNITFKLEALLLETGHRPIQ